MLPPEEYCTLGTPAYLEEIGKGKGDDTVKVWGEKYNAQEIKSATPFKKTQMHNKMSAPNSGMLYVWNSSIVISKRDGKEKGEGKVLV